MEYGGGESKFPNISEYTPDISIGEGYRKDEYYTDNPETISTWNKSKEGYESYENTESYDSFDRSYHRPYFLDEIEYL